MNREERCKIIDDLMDEHRGNMEPEQYGRLIDELTEVSDTAAARKQALRGDGATLDVNTIELRGIEREESLMWCAIKEKYGEGR
ncbi:hypothetical protein CIG75_19025 [Tumebacillus algifaecis]|uniref:Uncharacterized protein n=1 Tax=Tumebacillus algifaecis TaxID=1214604 RepID=A0A223D5R4_9BACL|nr:hypothetical protein [Tumebacillus algifaecis]ASS76827.1 hypothetical protein CIG75_19025 [Tumebacillus algifaecis]